MWQCPFCYRLDEAEDIDLHTAHVLDCPRRKLRDDHLPYVTVPEAEIPRSYTASE